MNIVELKRIIEESGLSDDAPVILFDFKHFEDPVKASKGITSHEVEELQDIFEDPLGKGLVLYFNENKS